MQGEAAEAFDISRESQATREAYTDAHGTFGFQLGETQFMQDASVSGADMRGSTFGNTAGGSIFAPTTQSRGITQRELMGCELRASLAGFVSESIDLAGRQLFDNPDVGTIMLHRMGKVEGTKISVTTMLAPKDARKAFERARNARQKNRMPEAEQQLQKAIALYPRYAEAMSLLGEIYSEEGRTAEAEKMFQAATEADPKFIGPLYNLAMLASERRDWQPMAELTAKAAVRPCSS